MREREREREKERERERKGEGSREAGSESVEWSVCFFFVEKRHSA